MSDQDRIAKRAHELYLQRGSLPGHELDDWLQAETELAAQAAEPGEAVASERPAPAGGARRNRRDSTRALRT